MRHLHHKKSIGIFLGLGITLILLGVLGVRKLAEFKFGPPDPLLSWGNKLLASFQLIRYREQLINPYDNAGQERYFEIHAGEDASSVSLRLKQDGLLSNTDAFLSYMIWKGYDRELLPGIYKLSPSENAIVIAEILTSSGRTEIPFTILPGWRVEEVSESLVASGLFSDSTVFLDEASRGAVFMDPIPLENSIEGFLYPDNYLLSRTSTESELINTFVGNFVAKIPTEYYDAYSYHGLSFYDAVIIASIIQREAVHDDEMSLMASVFYNRMGANMKLQMDSTVQYALGFDPFGDTWWKSSLSFSDLEYPSPYNTYLIEGLPAGPISNPGLRALQAVAYPVDSPYFYFQAKCDESGWHNFTISYEEHLLYNCP